MDMARRELNNAYELERDTPLQVDDLIIFADGENGLLVEDVVKEETFTRVVGIRVALNVPRYRTKGVPYSLRERRNLYVGSMFWTNNIARILRKRTIIQTLLHWIKS